jgi:hypothetical protein
MAQPKLKGAIMPALTPEAVRDIALGKGGSYGISRDIIKHTLWDARWLGATPTNNAFFTQPINQPWALAGEVKTRNETNMIDTGKLPNGQTFLVKRIGVALILPIEAAEDDAETIVQSYYNIVQSSVFRLVVAGREFDFECHGSQFTPAVAVNAITAATVNSNRTGDFVSSGWISLDYIPIFLGPMTSFSVDQTIQNAHAYVLATVLPAACVLLKAVYCSIQVRLEGVLTRAK